MEKEEKQKSDEARKWIRKNKKILIEKFADPKKYTSHVQLVSVFMAGSPGAGKTEFSKRILEVFTNMVRIDPDEIRAIIPGYTGKKSYLMQSACALGVEKLIDACIDNKQDFLLDGMLVNFDKTCENINRCLKQRRSVQIFYIYQDPLAAWNFTKAREEAEERHIPRDSFITGFLKARENVGLVKDTFKDRVQLSVVRKNYSDDTFEIFANVSDIDKILPAKYTQKELGEIILWCV